MEAKYFFTSKTFYLNILAIAGILVQYFTGTEWIDAEAQVTLLAVINLILRMVTKKPIIW